LAAVSQGLQPGDIVRAAVQQLAEEAAESEDFEFLEAGIVRRIE
jgi:hypothetical protein